MELSINRWGNSAAIRLPQNILNQLAVSVGDKVRVVLKDNALIIEPVKQYPTLEEMLAKITPDNHHELLIVGRVGREIIDE